MSSKRSRNTVVILAGLALVAMVVWGVIRSTTSGDTAHIGVALPLTGDAAVYGQAIKDGIELAAEQDAADGTRITLSYEDDQGVPRQAISAIRRLIDVDRVRVVIGGAMSSTAEPIIPIIDEAQVVLVSPTATKPGLPEMSTFFFRLWPSDDYDGKVMAEVAYNDLKLRRIAILYINIAYGVGITEVFTREFGALGGTIVSSEGYRQGATDFRTLLTRIAAKNPDAIYVPGYVAEVGNILRQARELDIDTRFIGVNSLYDPQLIQVAGEAAEGAVFTYPAFDVESDNPDIKEFVTAFRDRYGRDPDTFAAQGYDGYRVIQRAIDSSTDPTGPAIRDALLSLDNYTGPGGTFTFTNSGDVERPLRLMTVRDGHFAEFEADNE
jgi:branched-chain amino acid transport system substrate-binding protein